MSLIKFTLCIVIILSSTIAFNDESMAGDITRDGRLYISGKIGLGVGSPAISQMDINNESAAYLGIDINAGYRFSNRFSSELNIENAINSHLALDTGFRIDVSKKAYLKAKVGITSWQVDSSNLEDDKLGNKVNFTGSNVGIVYGYDYYSNQNVNSGIELAVIQHTVNHHELGEASFNTISMGWISTIR